MALDIALPFYGDVAFMKQTVQSILNQTDPNWRLVVVDDGYPDETLPGWFEGLGDERIEYQRNVQNLVQMAIFKSVSAFFLQSIAS
jgi:hypothetical protein